MDNLNIKVDGDDDESNQEEKNISRTINETSKSETSDSVDGQNIDHITEKNSSSVVADVQDDQNDDHCLIDQDLYTQNDQILESLPDTSDTLLKDLDKSLTEKVRRRTIKGQIDGK